MFYKFSTFWWVVSEWIEWTTGEGQGSKDVSDQIDNEDMLDGAYDGKERPEEDKNEIPEEDNGIEMSEDFDSHLQVGVRCPLLFLLGSAYPTSVPPPPPRQMFQY